MCVIKEATVSLPLLVTPPNIIIARLLAAQPLTETSTHARKHKNTPATKCRKDMIDQY